MAGLRVGNALASVLLQELLEVGRLTRQLERSDHRPFGVQERETRDRSTAVFLPELVRVGAADDDANIALRRTDDILVGENGREQTALEASRRSSRLGAGETDQYVLLLIFGGLEGERELRESGEIPL